MNKSIKFLFFMMLILLVSINACGQNFQNTHIGKWVFDVDGAIIVIEFNRDSGKLWELYDYEEEDYEEFDYRIEGNRIVIEGEDLVFRVIDRNTLELNYDDEEYIGKRIESNVSSLSGKFYNVDDDSLFHSIEIVNNRTLRITGGAFGFNTTTAYDYTIEGSHLIIRYEGRSYIFDIMGNNIIVGDLIGFGNKEVFVKR